MEHPAVAEAGVIGKPDPVAMEIVKAFVSLKPGFEPSEALRRELLALRAHPAGGGGGAQGDRRSIRILPKTRSGKIMRRLLKARELGLPEGDTSTLEGATDAEPMTVPAPPPALDRPHALALLRQMRLHPALRGEGGRAVQPWARSAASSTSTSARRPSRWGRCRRSPPDDSDRRHLPRARPGARARDPGGLAHGRDVRQGQWLQPRSGRVDALLRRLAALLRRPRDRRGRSARSRWAWRWPTSFSTDRPSRRASSATARWRRESSTSR